MQADPRTLLCARCTGAAAAAAAVGDDDRYYLLVNEPVQRISAMMGSCTVAMHIHSDGQRRTSDVIPHHHTFRCTK